MRILAPARLRLQAIDAPSFAPFGKLVEMTSPAVSVNEGTALRADLDAFPADEARAGFHLITSIYEARARELPLRLGIVERHVHTPQLIMPLGGEGHAVVVCLSGRDGRPDLETLAAFECSRGQGVIYRPGLWHHPIAALCAPAQFLVQSWQDGAETDCEILPIADYGVVLDAPSRGLT